MLCQFTVTNYRCIKEAATLSMAAADGLSEHRESLIVDKDETSFLPLTAVYGPNGGGKSTILDALYSLCFKVMNPVVTAIEGVGTRLSDSFSHLIVPYLFDEQMRELPTKYSLVFRTENYEYEYNLSVLNDEVISESLYHKSIVHGRYTRVFIREKGNQFSLMQSLKRIFSKEESFAISPSLPLLSYLGIVSGQHPVIKDVVEWFRRKIQFLDYKDSFQEHFMNLPSDGEMKGRILHFLDAMDTCITDYRLEEVKDPSGSRKRVHIYTQHRIHDTAYELELHQESSGTIKVFHSLPFIISSLEDGGALIVDELDAKLHPALLQFIIGLFSNREMNPKGAQLVFASQDIMTMTSQNFRRDEIWFVAKNADEEAQMYALSDFRGENGKTPRKDASYSKQYMEGRYGADPFFKKLVGWRD